MPGFYHILIGIIVGGGRGWSGCSWVWSRRWSRGRRWRRGRYRRRGRLVNAAQFRAASRISGVSRQSGQGDGKERRNREAGKKFSGLGFHDEDGNGDGNQGARRPLASAR